MLEKLLNLLRSRTVWTIVIMFVVNGITGIRELFPGAWLPLVDAVLGLAAIYFRAHPRVNL